MKKETRYGLVGFGVAAVIGVVGLSVIGGTEAWKEIPRKVKKWAGLGTDDSPIIVAGGSMTVHSDYDWISTAQTGGVGSQIPFAQSVRASGNVDFTMITLKHVKKYKGDGTLAKVSVEMPTVQPTGWSLYLCTRTDLGVANRVQNVASSPNLCDGFVIKNSNMPQVTVTPLNMGHSYFKPTGNDIDIQHEAASANAKSRRFEYATNSGSDNGCNLTTGLFCEHIGYILLTDNNNAFIQDYVCAQGECKIFIGGIVPKDQ